MDEMHGDLHQWNGQMDASSAKDFPYSVEYGSSEPNWQLPILWKKREAFHGPYGRLAYSLKWTDGMPSSKGTPHTLMCRMDRW